MWVLQVPHYDGNNCPAGERRAVKDFFRWKRESRVYLGHEGAVVVPGIVVPSVSALDDRPVGATDRRRWQSGWRWIKQRRRDQRRTVGGFGQIGAFEPRIDYLRVIHVVHMTLGVNPPTIGLDRVRQRERLPLLQRHQIRQILQFRYPAPVIWRGTHEHLSRNRESWLRLIIRTCTLFWHLPFTACNIANLTIRFSFQSNIEILSIIYKFDCIFFKFIYFRIF